MFRQLPKVLKGRCAVCGDQVSFFLGIIPFLRRLNIRLPMKTSQPRLITTCTMELCLASPAEPSSGKQTMEKTRDQRNGSKTQSHFCDQYGSCPDVLWLASCRAQRGKGIVRSLCRFFLFSLEAFPYFHFPQTRTDCKRCRYQACLKVLNILLYQK